MDKVLKTGGFSFFALWFGAAVSLAEIMTGGLTSPLGLKKGIAVILAGHLIGCLILALTGVIGFKEGKPSLVASRKSLGKYGSYIISIFNIVQLVGWTAVMLIQCAKSVQPVTEKFLGTGNLTVITVVVGAMVGIWALSTDKGLNVVNNIAVLLLGILCIVILGVIFKNGEAKPVTDSISLGVAFELSIVMPLSWVPLISDYTRTGKSAKGSFLGSFLGYFIGSSFMYITGLAAAIYSGTTDPVEMLSKFNMGISALLVVILATVTTTFLDVYSSVMTTLNLTAKISRKKLIIAFTVLGTLLALFFKMEEYESFLYMIGSLFAPAFAVILTDYFIIKRDYSLKKINIAGIAAAIGGTAFYYFISKFDLVVGSSLPSMAVAAAIYLLLDTVVRMLKLGSAKI